MPGSQKAPERGLFRQYYLDALFAAPAEHITPLRGSELWQVALLEMWLQTRGHLNRQHQQPEARPMAGNKGRPTPKSRDYSYRLKRMREHCLKPTIGVTVGSRRQPRQNSALDCGWGRLVFGQTYADAAAIAEALRSELPDQRDVAFYIRNPHVLLAAAPLDLFLDPSHTYRLDLGSYRPSKQQPSGFFVRWLTSRADVE